MPYANDFNIEMPTRGIDYTLRISVDLQQIQIVEVDECVASNAPDSIGVQQPVNHIQGHHKSSIKNDMHDDKIMIDDADNENYDDTDGGGGSVG